jgi:hypothetical protein
MRTMEETKEQIKWIETECAKYTRNDLAAMLVTLGTSGEGTETEQNVEQVLRIWGRDRER